MNEEDIGQREGEGTILLPFLRDLTL